MVYTNYTLKPRLENKQTIFFNTLKLYSAQKIGLNRKPCAKKRYFSATARLNLDRQPLRKGAFFRKPKDKKESNRQTARL